MSLKLGLRNKIRSSRAGGFTGLLDQSFATGATAAYSLRRLKSSATKAVRVREDSGNTETDIGFVNGLLDETAISNHCGSANGFVSKWYDQSGNGNDASNSTASEQPQIVNSGSVIQENGKPALLFDGSDDGLTALLSQTAYTDTSVVSIINYNGSSSFPRHFHLGSGNASGDRVILFPDSSSDTRLFTPDNDLILDKDITDSHAILSYFEDQNGAELRRNSNTLKTGSTPASNKTNLTKIGLGFLPDPADSKHFTGTFQELVFYDKGNSNNINKIETNINNHYSIF